jgi:DNA mismatch repair ATPase MutS
LKNKSVIIAGSNRSGKTTFLRTVGINNILAQTVNTCFANEFKIPLLKTITSLHNFDSIVHGESFYFAEAKNLLKVLDSNIQTGYLIIIDELFKGTNSIERTAISKGTLAYLHKNCGIVFASTHDLELIKLLYFDYEPYHFNESINEDEILFDYKIKKGNLYVFNAINTLIKMGFPNLLMQEVKKTFSKLEQMYKRSNDYEILHHSLK